VEFPDGHVLECHGVVVDAAGLSELRGGQRGRIEPLESIRSVRHGHGALARFPLLLLVIGLLLIGVGGLSLRLIVSWLREGGVVTDLQMFFVVLIPIGAWIAWDALRRGHYLEVSSTRGIRRLVFESRASAEEVTAFLAQLDGWGYPVKEPPQRLGRVGPS